MFSWIRRRCSYANVVATFALFFAMTGGALAASHYLITSTKQIKPSVLSALKGKAGLTGPAGPAGTAGAVGAKGETGATGTGTPGVEGHEGKEGKEGPKGKEGKEGHEGKEGLPGVIHPGETLAPGASETGMWAASGSSDAGKLCVPEAEEAPVITREGGSSGCPTGYTYQAFGSLAVGAISFTIPLAAPLGEQEVSDVAYEGHIAGHCEGSFEEPTAEPGNLCVYEGSYRNNALGGLVVPDFADVGNGSGALKTGAIVFAIPENSSDGGIVHEGPVFASGSWAVTAPAA
jgi:hypothetical protein